MQLGNEIIDFILYVVLKMKKIYYEIILFYDTKTIKEIIKSRVLGYLLIIGFSLLLGKKLLLIYISIGLSFIILNTIINIYIVYKKKELKNHNMNELINIIKLHGFELKVWMCSYEIDALKLKTMLMFCVLQENTTTSSRFR
jgi:hypothetical protein